MLIRCVDCGARTPAYTLPNDYFLPKRAVRFWLLHGHIPKLWTFSCECGTEMVSGPQVAREMKWDDFQLAQNDWGFWQEHRAHASGKIWLPS